MPIRRAPASAVVFAAMLASCAGEPEATITLVTGEETDVLGRAPAAVTLVVEESALDGTRTEIARAALPVDTFSLGDQPRGEAGALVVRGLDAAGSTVVRGETLLVQWGALERAALEVFVQRTGEWARMPRGPAAAEVDATTVVAGRYVLAAKGTSAALYDLLALRSITGPVLPRPARSVASVGAALLVVDEAGATTLDLATSATYPLDAPTGGTWAEIAGARRTIAPDGTQYLVGGTRASGGPSARVLVLDPSGKASFASLAAAREGACATFVEGRGLVVYGGADAAPGGEVLVPGAATAAPLPFPPDAVRGCGLAALDGGRVVVAGGGADVPARVVDLACTSGCAPSAWPDSIPIARAEAAALGPDAVLVVGDGADGATRAFRASSTGTREVPLRAPRRGARLLRSPTGSALVVGGGAGIEQYVEGS